jgi:hypothetical protein
MRNRDALYILGIFVVILVLLEAGGIVGVWTSTFGSGWLGVLLGAGVLSVPLAWWLVKERRRIRQSNRDWEELRRRGALGPPSSDR